MTEPMALAPFLSAVLALAATTRLRALLREYRRAGGAALPLIAGGAALLPGDANAACAALALLALAVTLVERRHLAAAILLGTAAAFTPAALALAPLPIGRAIRDRRALSVVLVALVAGTLVTLWAQPAAYAPLWQLAWSRPDLFGCLRVAAAGAAAWTMAEASAATPTRVDLLDRAVLAVLVGTLPQLGAAAVAAPLAAAALAARPGARTGAVAALVIGISLLGSAVPLPLAAALLLAAVTLQAGALLRPLAANDNRRFA